MARYKRILGDHLHARKLRGQQAEAAIGVAVLNRMIDAGRPGLRPRRLTDQSA